MYERIVLDNHPCIGSISPIARSTRLHEVAVVGEEGRDGEARVDRVEEHGGQVPHGDEALCVCGGGGEMDLLK